MTDPIYSTSRPALATGILLKFDSLEAYIASFPARGDADEVVDLRVQIGDDVYDVSKWDLLKTVLDVGKKGRRVILDG